MLTFEMVYRQVKSHTLIDESRCLQLWKHVQQVESVSGDIAECGCFKGGSARLICHAQRFLKRVHLFDTFSGIPEEQREKEDHTAGKFSSREDDVREYLKDCPWVEFHPGLVPGTLTAIADKTFSFVHLDMDLYFPTIEALHFFWPRMNDGGIIMLDDYRALKGINKAVEHFSEETGIDFVHTANVQCKFTKGEA